MQKKHLLLILLLAFFAPLAVNAQETINAYELVTASQTDWSGNYVLVGPWNTYKGYAFNGVLNYSQDGNLGGTTAVTINETFNGTFLSSIGNAPVLTIAKSTYDDSYYSIRINGGDYLLDGRMGLATSSVETDESYWNIIYTTNGMQIYNPIWTGGTYYLYFIVYRDTSSSDYGTEFYICEEGDLDHYAGYSFDYVFPVLYKETTLAQHNITVTQSAGGTISADANTACMGDMITLSATPDPGYFFAEWIVKDASNNTIYVTNNKIIMPNSDVTVTATFTQDFHVTLVQTANGTISANPTTNLHAGDHVTLTATPDNSCRFLAWYVYKTGNPRDVIPVVNNGFVMPSGDVTVLAAFVNEEGHVQTLGGGSQSTDPHFPTTAIFKYSLTQQIYTAAEIVYNGRITKIAFKATSNFSNARSLDIYMSHTSKSSFDSDYDWEVMGHDALVYSGNVSFAYDAWTTITLNTPFEYDGTSNLNICIVDKTGNGESDQRSFGMYYTGSNRALYTCGNNNDYSNYVENQLSNLNGNRYKTNNQIVFTIEPSGRAESLSISPDEISDFSYLKGQGPSQAHKLDIVGVDLKNNITLTAPDNFEISSTEDGPYNASLTIPRVTSNRNRNVQTWDFEDGLQGWTIVDTDGDGYNWEHCANDPDAGGHGGSTGLVRSQTFSYDGHGFHPLDPDNWLISPQVTLGGSFSLWARSQSYYFSEHFAILVSTTNTGNFTMLGEWTLSEYDAEWHQFTVDLSTFAGQTGYIAVRHYNCSGQQYYINVDDFVLDTDTAIVEMPVTITPATVFVRMKGNLGAGTYSGTLTASAGSDANVNGSVSLSGEVIAAYNITLTANPTEGGAVAGAGTYAVGTEVTVSARTNSPYQFINWTENGTVVSTDASYTFTVTGDRNLVANFGFTKDITGYGNDDNVKTGWYLIASPLAADTDPMNVTNLINTTGFDLYAFDQTQELEWFNFKPISNGAGRFNLENGKGYLYANSQNVTLVFTGAGYSGNTKNVRLTYSDRNPDTRMRGMNLVGNPFPESVAYIDRDFYTIHPNNSEFVATSGAIEPMEGAIVQTTNISGEDMTFSKTPSKSSRSLSLNLTQGRGGLIDRAIVHFDESKPLSKLQLRDNSTSICVTMDGMDYASIAAENQGEMPVSFKAEENGTYTLSFNSENVSFGYLHLVDNMTGNDVDLLANPSYTFEAKKTDYRSRFKLVFATGTADDTFAFCSNGNWVINNDGNATLQVIDVNGRIIRSESINGCANVNLNVANGVYMIRLINGSNVKTQKVVVR